MRIGTPLCCALLLSAVAGPASANGVVRDSIGGTASGRGGTNIAHADNGAVLLSNPAGIINAPGRGLFEIGVDGLFTDLDYADAQNNTADFMPFALPQVSVIRKSDDDRWAAGFGVFAPAGFGADWDMNAPFPINGKRGYESLGMLVKVIPGLAYRVNDRLSIGATLGLGYSYAELEGPLFIQSHPLLQGTPTLIHLKADGLSPTWSVGAQYDVSERTRIGITYTSETRFRLEGDAEATIFGLNPLDPTFGVSSKFDLEADLVWPQSVGIGITHWLTCRQRVSADVLWFDWSHAFDRLDLKLSNPSQAMFGPLAPIRDSLPLEWNDSVSIRLGHEFWLTPCDVVRVGYIHNTKVIPQSTLTPYIPATLEHSFTVGYGHQRRDVHYNVGYEFGFGPTQHVDDSQIVGGDFDDSVVTSRAHWLFFSLTKEF
ncbi:MAG TPA: outer membrane protein transport protein [Planctomycetaceae bacterium]|nr:outer membrane protein transport protein [Planctomycetaceae bacterium]